MSRPRNINVRTESAIKRDRLEAGAALLAYEFNLEHGRFRLLGEIADDIRSRMNYLPNSPSLDSASMADLHTRQLEMLSLLFMLIEDFLVFSHYLRAPNLVRNLPESIAAYPNNVPGTEIGILKAMKLRDISRYLLFPEFGLLPLTKRELSCVKGVYRDFAKKTYGSIKRIVRFYEKYVRVYNKYKHGFSAIVGLFQQSRPDISSHIYLRDASRVRISSGRPSGTRRKKLITLVIPTDLAVLEHYQTIVDDVNFVFVFLLYSHLYKIYRANNPYLLGEIPVEGMTQGRYARIVETINGVPSRINFKVNFKITFPEKARLKARKAIKRDFIYIMPKDIISSRRGKNYKMTLSK